MNEEILKLMDERIAQLIANGTITEKTILYLSPLNEYSLQLANKLKSRGFRVAGYCISANNAAHQEVYGVPVMDVSEALIPFRKEKIVLLTDASDTTLLKQMDFLEYWHNVKRFWVTEPKPLSFWKRRLQRAKRPIFVESKRVLTGYRTFQRLTAAQHNQLYLFPHRSIGDIYLLGLYLNKGVQLFDRDFTLCVVGNACGTVAKYMGFQKVSVLTQYEMDSLCRLKLMLQDRCSAKIIHYHYIYHTAVPQVLDTNHFHFIQCYDTLVFGEPLGTKPIRLPLKEYDVSALCEEYGMAKGKTVILAPYAKSLPQIHMKFWEELAEELSAQGYQVFTNCNGSTEIPIKGTSYMPISLEEANSIVEYAGYFIGIRSGFADLVCGAKAKKIVVYPKCKGYKTKLIDFYSFQNIPNAVGVDEIEVPLDSSGSALSRKLKAMRRGGDGQ